MTLNNNVFWHTPYQCLYEDEALRLLRFSEGSQSLLILPPQSGHHSCIADLDDGQSVVACAIQHTDFAVHAIEWKSCTVSRAMETVTDLLAQVTTCIDHIGARVHLVGMSQGGWLSTLYAALHTHRLHSLSVAGAPIDTQRGDSVLHPFVRLPMAFFQASVMMGGGMMRGHWLSMAWKAAQSRRQPLARPTQAASGSSRLVHWERHGQNLAGGWFLWALDTLFKQNCLGRNALYLGDQHVDLGNIHVPVHIVTGTEDTIVPPEQSLALAEHVRGQTHAYSVRTGHTGVFISREGIATVWPRLLRAL